MDPVESWLDAKEVRRMAESLMAPAPDEDKVSAEAGYGNDFEGFAQEDEPSALGDTSDEPARPLTDQVEPVDDGAKIVDAQAVSTGGSAPGLRQRLAAGNALANARRLAEGSGMLARSGGQQVEPSSNDQAGQAGDDVAGEPEKPAESTEDRLPSEPLSGHLAHFSENLRRDFGARAMFVMDKEGRVLLDEVQNAKLIRVAATLVNASYRGNRPTAGAAGAGHLHVKIGASETLEIVPVETRHGLLIVGAIFPVPLGAERVRQVAGLLSGAVEPRP